MDTNLRMSLKIPVYYESDLNTPSILNPFMVAPYKDFQDTIILGPTRLAREHNDLLNALYGRVEGSDIQKIGATVCTLGDHCCFAILLPLSKPDNAG